MVNDKSHYPIYRRCSSLCLCQSLSKEAPYPTWKVPPSRAFTAERHLETVRQLRLAVAASFFIIQGVRSAHQKRKVRPKTAVDIHRPQKSQTCSCSCPPFSFWCLYGLDHLSVILCEEIDIGQRRTTSILLVDLKSTRYPSSPPFRPGERKRRI